VPVFRYLDLSTSHLTERESREINSAYAFCDLEHSPRVIPHDYGAWVNAQEKYFGSWSDEDEAALVRTRPNLAACIAKAREHDCYWINFDEAAGVEHDLPVFEW
jgi:hypothetical protein